MASVGHIAVGLAVARGCVPEGKARWRLAVALVALSLLPDADVVAFALGIPYEAPWGHRGASHSLAMAAIVGVAVALSWPALGRAHRLRWGLVVFGVVASHGLLDMLTDGGRGVALWWPVSDARHFFPFQPLPVAPIGRGLLSSRGLYVIGFETLVFAPLLAYGLWPRRRITGR